MQVTLGSGSFSSTSNSGLARRIASRSSSVSFDQGRIIGGAQPKIVRKQRGTENIIVAVHGIGAPEHRNAGAADIHGGIMVGIGETREEVMQVMDDMRSAGIDFLTIGQYLQPTRKHAAVDRFVTPEEFAAYETIARAKGFLMVASSPLTRSSYHADEDFAKLRDAREAQLARR